MNTIEKEAYAKLAGVFSDLYLAGFRLDETYI